MVHNCGKRKEEGEKAKIQYGAKRVVHDKNRMGVQGKEKRFSGACIRGIHGGAECGQPLCVPGGRRRFGAARLCCGAGNDYFARLGTDHGSDIRVPVYRGKSHIWADYAASCTDRKDQLQGSDHLVSESGERGV